MMRHRWLVAVAAVLLCAGVVAVAFHYSALPTQLKIAVGPANSEDLRVIQAVTQHLARERASVRLRLIVKDGGTRETAAAIDSGEVDLAVVRRDVGMPKEGRVVAVLRKNIAVLIVPPAQPAKAAAGNGRKAMAKRPAAKPAKPEKIEKIENLLGKRVGIIGRSQSNVDLLKAILRQYNIPSDKVTILSSDAELRPNDPDKVSVVQFDPNSVSSAIRDHKVDAILAVGPVSSTITADAIAATTRDKNAPTFLDIDAAEAIAERNPVYEATEIKAGAFGGSPARPEEAVDTIGVNHYIVARNTLSEDSVAAFTRFLFTTRSALAADVPAVAKIEAPDTDKDASVPVHPGAAAYIDGEMKTFFDRYSDFLYLGLMVVSFLGSGLAGLATYSKSTDRTKRLEVLEQLLAIAKSARAADNTQELDLLQHRIDDLISGMVRDVEGNTLDEAALAAFSISLDQAQLAVSDRRAALLGQPPRLRPAVASL
jgi:TRAP-type uncharacterized transport system substrate-binding protein